MVERKGPARLHVVFEAGLPLQDVRLVWSNCIFFNGKGSHYGRIGDRMSSMFEELWAGSGLDTGNSRHRRATAGVAAPKYEPVEEEKKPLRKAPSMRAQNHSRSTKVREVCV